MYNKINKGINELRLGDRIGKSGMIFVKRNIERDRQDRNASLRQQFVDAACPFCGSVKTYRFSYLKNGQNTSCGCMIGRHGHNKSIPARTEDARGNVTYDKGYLMNFGWVYEEEAGVDTYGNRVIHVHSKWVPEDKAVMPTKELDPVANDDGAMFCSRWANSYVDAKNIDLNKLLADADRKIDDKSEIQTRNPHKRGVISADGPDYHVTMQVHGMDELWIKNLLLSDPEIAKNVKDTAYAVGDSIFGKTADYIGDCLAKYADFRTVSEVDGKVVDVYEEFDSNSHRIKHPTARDIQVELGCASNNKGLLRMSTYLKAFRNRDAETVLAIRKFAMGRIQHNIIHNFEVGRNELPTVMRVTNQRGIEEAIAQDGQIVWTHVAKVSDFMAAAN